MHFEHPNTSERHPSESNRLGLPVDASLFDRLEALKDGIKDEERKEAFEKAVQEGKLRAFAYAGQVLDYLAPGAVTNAKEAEEDAHRIANALHVVNSAAQVFCGAQLDFSPEESNQHALKLFEAASLQYAFSKLGTFRRRVEEEKEEPKKVAEEMGFPSGLDVGRLSGEFSVKLDKLDPKVREGLWTKTQ